MLGKMEDEIEIEKLAGSTWWYGTDEIGLAKAANYYECDFVDISETIVDKAIDKLNRHLNKGWPAVICVDKWSHWIAVIAQEDGKYICVDSGMKKVIIVISEKELIRRWKYTSKKITQFSGYKLTPQVALKTVASFTIYSAKQLMTEKYEHLALHWDSYYRVIYDIAKIKHPSLENIMTFREFLRRNQKSIVELVADWYDNISYEDLNIIFDNFLFIANIYNMVIHNNDEKSAIISFTTIMTMYATELGGTYSYL